MSDGSLINIAHAILPTRNPPRPDMTTDATPADALDRSWVEHAPSFLRPYLRLMRLDRPIGVWLLFWPCVFGVALGDIAVHQPRDIAGDLRLIALFALGAIVMRGAGCTYNDIVDRDIDARVARTRGRPLPSGAISVTAAWLFLAFQCALGLAVLLQFNRFTILLGASSLVLIALYPFMKRITWWPQAWLGLTFNWGALVGFAAKTGRITVPALLLYAACIFWTLGYDTIYAQQDKEDDALIGVKSTARLFGERSRGWIAFFYLVALLLFLGAVTGGPRDLRYPILVFGAGGHFLWQVWRLDIRKPSLCLRIFRANRDVGGIIAAALLCSAWLHSVV
jgi:4-hydroxybenzoate polyprenyltransferase